MFSTRDGLLIKVPTSLLVRLQQRRASSSLRSFLARVVSLIRVSTLAKEYRTASGRCITVFETNYLPRNYDLFCVRIDLAKYSLIAIRPAARPEEFKPGDPAVPANGGDSPNFLHSEINRQVRDFLRAVQAADIRSEQNQVAGTTVPVMSTIQGNGASVPDTQAVLNGRRIIVETDSKNGSSDAHVRKFVQNDQRSALGPGNRRQSAGVFFTYDEKTGNIIRVRHVGAAGPNGKGRRSNSVTEYPEGVPVQTLLQAGVLQRPIAPSAIRMANAQQLSLPFPQPPSPPSPQMSLPLRQRQPRPQPAPQRSWRTSRPTRPPVRPPSRRQREFEAEFEGELSVAAHELELAVN